MKTILALVLFIPLYSCLNSSVRVYAAYLDLSVNGDAALQDKAKLNDVNGIRSALDDDFDLSNSKTPYVRLDLEIDTWNLELSGFKYKDSARSTLTNDYGNIPANSAVETELRVSNVKLAVLMDIVDVGPLEISGGLALNYMDVDMDVDSRVPQFAPNTEYEESDFQAPVPMLYVRGVLDVGIVRGELSAAWIEADIADVEGMFLDIDAMLVITPIPALDFFAGYRYINIDVDGKLDGQAFNTHIQLTGWYLGAGISF